MKHRTTFAGNVQTTYSDWAQSLVNTYPNGLKFELIAITQTVVAYSEGVDIGMFNFEKSQGELFWDSQQQSPQHPKSPQYHKFDTDTFIK